MRHAIILVLFYCAMVSWALAQQPAPAPVPAAPSPSPRRWRPAQRKRQLLTNWQRLLRRKSTLLTNRQGPTR